MPDVSGKLKRNLGEISGVVTFADNDINNWIKDSCHLLGTKYYQLFSTADGVVITPVPTNEQEAIIALQASIIVEEGEYAKASRGSVKYRDAAHSFDTTMKTDAYKKRMDAMEDRLKNLIKTENLRQLDPKWREFSDADGDSSPSASSYSNDESVIPLK
jgi:hypothetical protein